MSLLDRVTVAAPCRASWEDMRGDDRVRFCGACRMNVYSLSDMTREEAEALVRGREGRMCVRLFRRADGTTITRDCPVGLRAAARRRAAALVGRVVAALALAVASLTLGTGCRSGNGVLRGSRLREAPAIGRFLEWIDPTPVPVSVPRSEVTMGDISCPITPPPPPPPTAE